MNASFLNRCFLNRCGLSVATALAAVALAGCGSSYHNQSPTISTVSDQTIDMDGSTAALNFSVTDKETAATQLQVTATSSNPALVPANGITLAGTDSNRSVQVMTATDQFGTATITLTVTDYQGKQASSRFVLTVRDTRQAFSDYSKTVLASDANSDATDLSGTKFVFDNSDAEDAYDDVLATAP